MIWRITISGQFPTPQPSHYIITREKLADPGYSKPIDCILTRVPHPRRNETRACGGASQTIGRARSNPDLGGYNPLNRQSWNCSNIYKISNVNERTAFLFILGTSATDVTTQRGSIYDRIRLTADAGASLGFCMLAEANATPASSGQRWLNRRGIHYGGPISPGEPKEARDPAVRSIPGHLVRNGYLLPSQAPKSNQRPST